MPCRLSIIIPCYNSEKAINSCLEAVLEKSTVRPDEVLVIDDGSTDETLQIIRNFNVEVHSLKANMGAAYARNFGAAHAKNDILVFIDSDVAISQDALRQIKDHFVNDIFPAAVFGSYDSDPEVGNLASRYRNLLHHITHQCAPSKALHFWCGIGAIRKSAFEAVNGFDQDHYSRHIEDVELGYRLTDEGFDILHDPQIQGRHLKKWTVASIVTTDMFARAIPWTRLLLERSLIPSDFCFGGGQRASVVLAFSILLLFLASFAHPPLFLYFLICALGFISLNYKLFFLIRAKYGWASAIGAVPLHWLHHFVSGLGLITGTLSYFWQKRK